MPFLQLKLATTREQAEPLSEVLDTLGALAITLQDAQDQPIYAPGIGETPLWDQIALTALFDEHTEMPLIIQDLQSHFGSSIGLHATIELIVDQAWEHTWKDDFKPQCYLNTLWVYPSWDLPAERPAHSLILDPGMAFGTGKHPTTQLCLTWLAQNISHPELVIDYGCGSGILAIAALKLGAQKAYAVDNDPQALTATRANAEINEISATQLQTYLPENLPGAQTDILIANILAAPLIDLAPTFAQLLKPGGKMVLSGILAEQVDTIRGVYSSWVTFDAPQYNDEWACLSGTAKTTR
jgi:ribosomal protein L11 methyltransferase